MDRESLQLRLENFFAGFDSEGNWVGDYSKFREFLAKTSFGETFYNKMEGSRKLQFDVLLAKESKFTWKDTIAQGVISLISSGSITENSRREILAFDWAFALTNRLKFLQILPSEFSSDKKTFQLAVTIINSLERCEIVSKEVRRVSKWDSNCFSFTPSFHNVLKTYKLFKDTEFEYNISLTKIISPLKAPMISIPCNHKRSENQLWSESTELCGGLNHPLFARPISDKFLRSLFDNKQRTVGSKKQCKILPSRIEFSHSSSSPDEPETGYIPPALKSINKIQTMEWQYNEDFFNLVTSKEFELEEEEYIWVYPAKEAAEFDDENLISEPDSDKLNSTYLRFAKTHNQMITNFGFKSFYLHWFFDFRSRIYCSKTFLNPQGSDLQRALLMTCNSDSVNKPDIINEYICKFLNLKNRNKISGKIEEVFTDLYHQINSERFKLEPSFRLEVLGNSLKRLMCQPVNIETILKKKKYQFMAMVLEYRNFLDSNKMFWRIPLRLDATCNGLQHRAALTYNRKLAKSTRLINPDDSKDVYEEVAYNCKKSLEHPGGPSSSSKIKKDDLCVKCNTIITLNKDGSFRKHNCKSNKKESLQRRKEGKYYCGVLMKNSRCKSHNKLCEIEIVNDSNHNYWRGYFTKCGVEEHSEHSEHLCGDCLKMPHKDEENEKIRAFLFEKRNELTREVVKHGVMTKGYGARVGTIRNKLNDRINFLSRESWTNRFIELLADKETEIIPETWENKRYVHLEHKTQLNKFSKKIGDEIVTPIRLGYYPEDMINKFDFNCGKKCESKEFSTESNFLTCNCNWESGIRVFGRDEAKINAGNGRQNQNYLQARKKVMSYLADKIVTSYEKIIKTKQPDAKGGFTLKDIFSQIINDIQKQSVGELGFYDPSSWPKFESKLGGFHSSFVNLKKKIDSKDIESLVPFSEYGSQRISVNAKLHPEEVFRHTGYSPNFIHALDATHLHMIVNEFFKENPDAKTFLPVHDEFGVHPNDVESLQNCVAKTFRELHESEPLKQFWLDSGLKDGDYPIKKGKSFLKDLDGKSMVSF